jgi:hypothetical protein
MRGSLTKEEIRKLWEHFPAKGKESDEGARIDSAFLVGKYDTWGESQLRTKIRSHQDVGRKFYPDVFERYMNDDI